MSEPRIDGTLQARLDAAAGPDRVVRVVDLAIDEGIARRASDIHFEPTPEGLLVRYRVDGVLHTSGRLAREIAGNVVARLKVLAELLTYRTDIPQEGAVRPRADHAWPDLRVSTLPTVHGEKAVVRAFASGIELLPLEQLGLPGPMLAELLRLLQQRTGAIYLTGPSGSGKTTTIYACLQHLAQTGWGRHIVTVEDPVERWVAGVSQSQVRPGTEFDFARGLRSLLRHDPDVIMVGEIRDRETAATTAEAALTGHLVFSTLHAGSAVGVIGRLIEMGVEPHQLTSGAQAILNQRLLRQVCASCRGTGCDACRHAGYLGRRLIAELLVPDAGFRRAILQRADAAELERLARSAGMRTIREAAADALADGLTTQAEIDRVLGPR